MYLLLYHGIEFLFQVTVHLVAPTRQEKAAWITDIAQVNPSRPLLALFFYVFTIDNTLVLHQFFSSAWTMFISMVCFITPCPMLVLQRCHNVSKVILICSRMTLTFASPKRSIHARYCILGILYCIFVLQHSLLY